MDRPGPGARQAVGQIIPGTPSSRAERADRRREVQPRETDGRSSAARRREADMEAYGLADGRSGKEADGHAIMQSGGAAERRTEAKSGSPSLPLLLLLLLPPLLRKA